MKVIVKITNDEIVEAISQYVSAKLGRKVDKQVKQLFVLMLQQT
jgi:hypothetical protein